ncbi:MAG: LacI family DNA-binding transcriptional regulator [Opitutaceae bacterium]|jgi:DNA-binding LacI/PurR family transcriptional regulator
MPQNLRPKKFRATIKDVAAKAGVSIATVSRVMAGLAGAGAEVRGRVMAAVDELKYQPDLSARGLRARQRKLIGLVLPDLQNPFFTGLAHGVEDVLCDAGFTLLLGHSDGRAEREKRHFEVFHGEGVAGLVLVPSNAPEADYSALAAWNMPLVAVDRAPRGLGVDLVNTNNRESSREAVGHFLSLGYRRIALVNGPAGYDVSAERLAGAQEALVAAGLSPETLSVVNADFHQEGGLEAMRALLAAGKPPRAVLIANNLMTLGALQALHERRLRIPEDVAVIGFDDMPWATSLRPPLTAVAQPAEELGRTAAGLLLERLVEPARPVRQIILRNHLCIRASCGAPGPSRKLQP